MREASLEELKRPYTSTNGLLESQDYRKAPTLNYQTQVLRERHTAWQTRELHQINESPRESVQQSPRADKAKKATAPFSKRNITNELYKTLRIDLNETPKTTLGRSMVDSRNPPPAQAKPSVSKKPKYTVTSQTFYMQTLSQLQLGRKKPAVPTQGSMTDRSKRAEEVLAFTRLKKPKGANLSSVVEAPPPRDDLVERVMDSLKLLSRKEEEAKSKAVK